MARIIRAWRRDRENIAAVVLAIAALSTAWSSYQASIWGGIQASEYNRSTEMHELATRAADDAARSRMLDIGLFAKWLEAFAEDRPRLTTLYESHFRPEFRHAFQVWRDAGAAKVGFTTPFERPEYRLQRAVDADHYDAAASRALIAGRRANSISDKYVFVTVIFASVLFFAGAIRPLVGERTQTFSVVIAILLCGWALARLMLTPLAR